MPHSLDDLYREIETTIVYQKYHCHYKRTVELAEKYKILITGEGFEALLKQFIRREDDALFAQRKSITQPITPAVTAAIMNPFYKVGRTNNITKKIDFKKRDSGSNKITRVIDSINTFWGEKSLDKYLETRFTELSFSDPNSFIVTEFDQAPDENGVMSEIPKPRAFEVSSENAINYKFDNNTLEWLIARLPIQYKCKDKVVNGFSYTIYGPQYSLRFTQISIENYGTVAKNTYSDTTVFDGVKNVNLKLYRANDNDIYIVEEFEHKSAIIPAKRVGYKSDLVTNGETCVNPFHDGMAYLMKSVKTVSEHDLTMALHAFPQKFAYAPRCAGESIEIGCDHGKTPDGTTCKRCKGSGLAIHTTAQDAVIMRLPNKEEDMRDLSKLIYYAAPPIDLVKFQNEYILQLKDEFAHAVFNSEKFTKRDTTATEERINLESVYDTLFPYAENFSDMYRHIAYVSAYYVDVTDVIIIHQFPKDFKFKTLAELLAELKLASDSNAPGYVRKELSNDIAELQFIDKPEDLKRIRTKAKFYPFADKNDVEILYIISNGKTSKYNTILWANFDNIFTEIEEEDATKDTFYTLTYSRQKEIVKQKVDLIMAELTTEEPAAAMPFGDAAQ